MAVSVPGGSVGGTGPVRHSEGLSHLLDLLERAHPTWHRLAACRDSEVDFFSEKLKDINAARLVCRDCPVEPQCRHYGQDEAAGVWGGVAAFERGKGRRRAG